MSGQQRYLQIISGEASGGAASLARAGLALLEPLYRTAVSVRNARYDRGWRRQASLGRPVISVGNLTVGGTGKTPLVAWLCGELRAAGLMPAVLMRGYRARPGEMSDEQRLLETLLGESVPIAADPDRVAGAARVLAQRPEVQVFVLDDGFQHRRVRREVDLVLIDATRPFGYDHLLPRGLLREPIRALKRASGVIVTRAGLVPPPVLEEIRRRVSEQTPTPVFDCDFVPDGFVDAAENVVAQLPPKRALAICGIGNPKAFAQDLLRRGIHVAGSLEFDDHHHYTADDVAQIRRAAVEAGAAVLTTMKDWVKLQPLWPRDAATSIYISRQRARFAEPEAQRLIALTRLLIE